MARAPNPVTLYQGDHLAARLVDGDSEAVVVAFPDRVHPVGFDGPGWGEGFLASRRISAVYIACARIDWFQTPDFFVALAAIRAGLGTRRITTYGSSMGGYGALLSARALAARRCLALSPQYSIDPEIVPFERRYNDHAAEIGRFRHDLRTEAGTSCQHVVAHDPTHGLDMRHLRLIEQAMPVARLPVYGAGHGVLSMIVHAPAKAELAGWLTQETDTAALRRAVRTGRAASGTYLRRMANKAGAAGHGGLVDFAAIARKNGFGKLARRLAAPTPVRRKLPRLVVHCGLPKTGTTSLQAHFFDNAAAYRDIGIHYPTDGADPRDLNHAWLSKALRDGDTAQLGDTLERCPPDCHTVLLSDESLFVEMPGLGEAAREALANVLAPYPVTAVMVARDRTAWMRSFYLQSVQNRRPGPITPQPSARNLWQTPLSYAGFFAQPYCRALLDFDDMRRRIGNALGADTTRSLGFEPGHDVVETFCASMGWPRLGQARARALNPSISDVQAEILRQANALGAGPGRLIKSLIGLTEPFDPARLKPRRLAKLASLGRGIDWKALRFCENPPLVYSATEFADACAALQARAEAVQIHAGTHPA